MSAEPLNRRDFCRLGLAASLLARPELVRAQPAQPSPRPNLNGGEQLPIIDTHQHLWDLTRFKLPWLPKDGTLARSYSLDDYWKAAAESNIVKTIYMEVDVAPDQRQAEVDYVVALCKQAGSRMAAAVVGGEPQSQRFGEYVRRLKASVVVKGVRAAVRAVGAGDDFELNKEFVAGMRLLGEQGLSFDINVPPEHLPRAGALVDQAPETRYILDHCGNANVRAATADVDRWKRGIAEVAKRNGVMCKVSGFIANAKGHRPSAEEIAAVVKHVMESFGPDRVMFGGDWPVCTLAMPLSEWVETLRQVVADRPLAEQKKLFHDNAASFYGV
jgi:L-fuconolactonase